MILNLIINNERKKVLVGDVDGETVVFTMDGRRLTADIESCIHKAKAACTPPYYTREHIIDRPYWRTGELVRGKNRMHIIESETSDELELLSTGRDNQSIRYLDTRKEAYQLNYDFDYMEKLDGMTPINLISMIRSIAPVVFHSGKLPEDFKITCAKEWYHHVLSIPSVSLAANLLTYFVMKSHSMCNEVSTFIYNGTLWFSHDNTFWIGLVDGEIVVRTGIVRSDFNVDSWEMFVHDEDISTINSLKEYFKNSRMHNKPLPGFLGRKMKAMRSARII